MFKFLDIGSFICLEEFKVRKKPFFYTKGFHDFENPLNSNEDVE